MKMRAALTVIVAFAGMVFFADSAAAKTIPLVPQKTVKKNCDGAFWPKTGNNSTYGCLNRDGSGIVCGGVEAKYKNNCSKWKAKMFPLPTREALDKIEEIEDKAPE